MSEVRQRLSGYCVTFNSEKGWGWVTTGTEDYFCHWRAIIMPPGTWKALRPGQRVSFNVGQGKDGRIQALSVLPEDLEETYAPDHQIMAEGPVSTLDLLAKIHEEDEESDEVDFGPRYKRRRRR